jgi:hypothetical protein
MADQPNDQPQLLTSYGTLEEIPDAYRSLFVERPDGRWIANLGESGGFGVRQTSQGDVTGLRTALAKERQQREAAAAEAARHRAELEQLRAERSGAGDGGTPPQDLPRALAEERARAKREADEAHRTALAAREAEWTKRETAALNAYRRNAIRSAIAQAGVQPHFVEHAVADRVRVVRDDQGEPSIEVLDDRGQPWMISDKGDTRSATVEDLLGSMRNDQRWAPVFPGELGSGAGARGSGSSAPARGLKANPFDQSSPAHFNRTLAARIAATDPSTARQMVAMAKSVPKDLYDLIAG